MHWMLMPLRRYADFQGRSRRREYWMFALLNALIGIFVGLVFLLGYAAGMSQTEMDTWLMPVVYLASLYSLVAFIPGVAVTIRRLHDTDRSGWNVLWALVPLFGALLLLVYYITEGTRGPNRFGADPKGDAFA